MYVIRYGKDIPDESELRLGGDIDGGKRVIELGVSPFQNSIACAHMGAKAIAVDPRPGAISDLRAEAGREEVTVQCHLSDLGDLGFATSASVELVVAVDSLEHVDDLGRVLRQVNRVLRSSRPLVLSLPHPYQSFASKTRPAPPPPPRHAAESSAAADGAQTDQLPTGPVQGELTSPDTAPPVAPRSSRAPKPVRTIGEWFTALTRSNFRVDQILELGADAVGLPTTLLIRAVKEGD